MFQDTIASWRLIKGEFEPCENMKKLDPAKIITNGLGSHGTAKKLTVQTYGIESYLERRNIEGKTEVEIIPLLSLAVLMRAVRIRCSSSLLKISLQLFYSGI